MVVNAVVMAGRANQGKLREVSDAPYEGLIDIAGRPMLDWVIKALKDSKRVKGIVVVAPAEVFRGKVDGAGVTFVEPADTMLKNILRGLEALPPDELVLAVSSDLPLLTGHVVDDFLAQCEERPAELYYPIIEKNVIEPKYPGVHRTYAKLREGTFTGGNVLLVHPRLLKEKYQKAQAFVDARKSPFKMARVLGFGFVLKLLLNRLSLKELEKVICKNFELSGAAIPCREAEIGLDVDKPSDFELATQVLSGAKR
ncbi:MAG TPA: nucleotidyltransferase family protein [Bacillota bacterium]|jgi:GTP:adenosylcobinamide-phosphate guanylyltransferase